MRWTGGEALGVCAKAEVGGDKVDAKSSGAKRQSLSCMLFYCMPVCVVLTLNFEKPIVMTDCYGRHFGAGPGVCLGDFFQ
jgi:hypothetical protein